MKNARTTVAAMILGLAMTIGAAAENRQLDYQVLSTSRTSTMEKELNQAAAAGYRFLRVTNRPNIFGGEQLVVVTVKDLGGAPQESREYRVLSARGTSKLQKVLQEAAGQGWEYREQTTLPNIFGGSDVIVILERTELKQ